ncbi:hypothetical protein ACFSQQ_02160 [Mesorhizobium kowhaii]|uniref:hypothetical protein n=1 Tax=Mesorhizobium kowhaii TaxID=1300272 RepID=UPI003645B772
MIGDLLHGLDLHGNVEPVDDVGCRLRHGAGQPLQDFGAVRDHGDVAKAAIAFLLKCVEGSIPDCSLVGVAGHEVAATDITPTAAAASSYNELEVSRGIGIGAANMCRIDADDELFASVAGKLHFKLASIVPLSSRAPFFLRDLFIEPFTDPDGPLAHGHVRLGGFNGQKFAKHLRCLPIRHHASQSRRQFNQFRRGSIRADLVEWCEGSDHARMAIPAEHPTGIANLHGAENSSDFARPIAASLKKRR